MVKKDSLKAITLKLKEGIDIPVEDTETLRPATDAINAYEEGRIIRVPKADGGMWVTKAESVVAIIVETAGTTSEYTDDICQNI